MQLRRRNLLYYPFGLDEHTIACLAGDLYKDIGIYASAVSVTTNDPTYLSILNISNLGYIKKSFYSVGAHSCFVKETLNNTAWNLPASGNWTVEFWCNYISVSNSMNGFLIGPTYNNTYGFHFEPGSMPNLTWTFNGSNKLTVGGYTANTWHHTALVNYNGTCRHYLDGTLAGSFTPSYAINGSSGNSGYMMLGNCSDTSNLSWNGYYCNWRVSNVARYTTNFNINRIKRTLGSMVTKSLLFA